MLQKNHHFLFPQTYFGPIEDPIEDPFCEEEEEEEEATSHVPWTLVLEPETMNPLQSKIGLYIHWGDLTQF
jgi:hypothetical protein